MFWYFCISCEWTCSVYLFGVICIDSNRRKKTNKPMLHVLTQKHDRSITFNVFRRRNRLHPGVSVHKYYKVLVGHSVAFQASDRVTRTSLTVADGSCPSVVASIVSCRSLTKSFVNRKQWTNDGYVAHTTQTLTDTVYRWSDHLMTFSAHPEIAGLPTESEPIIFTSNFFPYGQTLFSHSASIKLEWKTSHPTIF